MRLASWLGRRFAPSPLATRRQTPARFRPRVERLECRAVPATLLVSQTGSLGGTPAPFSTIQNAVDASSPGDTILVGPGLYEEQVLITKDNLTLQAAAPCRPSSRPSRTT